METKIEVECPPEILLGLQIGEALAMLERWYDNGN